jgi:hypothetical protein
LSRGKGRNGWEVEIGRRDRGATRGGGGGGGGGEGVAAFKEKEGTEKKKKKKKPTENLAED